MTIDERGQEASEIREFATFTDELIKLRDWLRESDCPIVAMESTGVYWRGCGGGLLVAMLRKEVAPKLRLNSYQERDQKEQNAAVSRQHGSQDQTWYDIRNQH